MYKKLFVIVFICVLLGGGFWYIQMNNKEISLENLDKKIKQEIGLEAKDVSECKVVPYGAKACGGPRGFLVYSASSTDEKKLQSLTAEFSRLEAEKNKEEGSMSDCSITPEPDLELVGGFCKVR